MYVFERIELELGLAITDSDTSYSCPIFIHPDDSIKNRYFCTHETGVHIVNVPFINDLEKILESSEGMYLLNFDSRNFC